jgi:glutamate N-acetyltransferase / amino-acid N-acetyltransferase
MINNAIQIIKNGNICTPSGFKASGIAAGLKVSGSVDMALIVSDRPAVAAAAFTSSKVQAAPVQLCKKHLAENTYFRAIIANSGNANACTGGIGLRDSQETAELTAKGLNLPPGEIFVSSTGRIGTYLPMDKIKKGIESAINALSLTGGPDAAMAIMTTDTKPKEIAVSIQIANTTVKIAGIAKGAGMIAPNMQVPHATMLSYITTDAVIEKNTLADCLREANEKSYNKISVDGDTSTNDTVIILANGAAGNPVICKGSTEAQAFCQALLMVMEKLAKDIVLDGEGITKFVTVQVKNAASKQDAKLATKAISESLLCKTAWFGCDPNWGRIIAAAGYSGANFDSENINLYYDGLPVVIRGVDAGTDEAELEKLMKKDSFTVTLDLNTGSEDDEMWTNDISYEYVKINADYHT